MRLYGREWTRRELEARVGRIEQIGGLRRLRWAEGAETDNEQIQVRTGAGLSYAVSPSRGMDISLAEFGGVPMTWQAAGGDIHPAFYDNRGEEWLRTAVGGLMFTCGLVYVGAAAEDQGQPYGMHGRAHHLPARHVSLTADWQGDEYVMEISGVVEETAIYGERIRLKRSIRTLLGSNRIEIHDVVENFGFETTPHMILYHFNFGFPLMAEETKINIPSGEVVPYQEGIPVDGYSSWQAPDPDFEQQVFYHQKFAAEKVSASIHTPNFPVPGQATTSPLTVTLSWSSTQLPWLVQWKMAGAGVHVMGIEPANCHVDGRAAERQRGTLQMLAPGESRSYDLALDVAAGAGATGQGSGR